MAQNNNSTRFVAPHHKENFRGYSIQELRNQRIITGLRRDFLREKLMAEITSIRKPTSSDEDGGKKSKWMAIAGNVMKMMSYADFIAVGMALFRSGRKVASIFRRRK